MITFVPCNIFEWIWYSEFILGWKQKVWISVLQQDAAMEREQMS